MSKYPGIINFVIIFQIFAMDGILYNSLSKESKSMRQKNQQKQGKKFEYHLEEGLIKQRQIISAVQMEPLQKTLCDSQYPSKVTEKFQQKKIFQSKIPQAGISNQIVSLLPRNNVSKCKCSKSRCLKLYCECFSRGRMCSDECGCFECRNNLRFKKERNQKIWNLLEINPQAFWANPKEVEQNFSKKCDCNSIENCGCFETEILQAQTLKKSDE